MSILFGHDPVRAEVHHVLSRMQAGELVDETVERKHLDLKEEAGRRGPGGVVLSGGPENADAARALAGESACMANTPGGGALIVGVANDGTLIGAELDAEWLRSRIFDLTDRKLTVDVQEVDVRGTRVLVVISPPAIEPIQYAGRLRWRVDDRCVEVDASTWHNRRLETLRYDWSADDSGVPLTAVRSQAIAVAREFLNASGDAGAEELATAPDAQVLRRLNAVTGHDTLTNAGLLAFVGREEPGLDYVHREYAGGDSTVRVRRPGRSLLEELADVFSALEARNPTRHIEIGLVVRQIRDLPTLAAREAIVNGVAHRVWTVANPTVVEHIGRTLRVTSPGGFFGGVNSSNIITHPSQSRNASLAQLLADLRVAEREGIGVDRMVREMIRVGHPQPSISEIDGPLVRTALVGDAVDSPWITWLAAISPQEETHDVSSLLVLRHLVDHGWIDEATAAPLIQLSTEEARGALAKLNRAQIDGSAVLRLIDGTPEGTPAAWCLSGAARDALARRDQEHSHVRVAPTRRALAVSYARARGRISSTELGSMLGMGHTNMGATLKALAETDGLLKPSNDSGRGRGFFYRWVGGSS